MSVKEEALKEIAINSLSVRQAAKWFLWHERLRHLDDIAQIDEDLRKLSDVVIPNEAFFLLNERFNISEGVTTEEKERLRETLNIWNSENIPD